MPYGPGKFEGEPASTFLLYQRGLDGDSDEDFSHENLGWWAKFEGFIEPFNDEIEAAQLAGYTDAEIAESLKVLKTMSGAILHENDFGFVRADIYDNEALLIADWNATLSAYAEETGI